ncbi:hypothetical protein [Pseudonocardia petroleophila]|uniref:hypothetical protein n=1 Tax=Pseudonocardia petroleophila TaxID=37331 RepID=UPI0031CE1D36
MPAPVTPLRSRTDLPRPRPTAVSPLPRPTDQEPPGPTPFGRRRPLAPVADFPRHPGPPAGSDSPALASIGDPFGGPIDDREASRTLPPIDEADPLGIGRLPVEHDAAHRAGGEDAGEPAPPVSDDWLADWISGDWAISRSTSSPDPLDPDQPLPGLSGPVEDAPASPEPPRPVPRPAPQPSARPVPRPSPVRPPAPAAPAPSETAARLSDADRDLLARLQSELGGGDAPRPRVSRRAGIAGENGNGAPNGRGPHPPPPDIAG